MDKAVHELLAFYQRELRESRDGQRALGKLGITSPEVVEHFGLGWCSGRALKAASEAQYQELRKRGLVSRRQERFVNSVVIPVFDAAGSLVDLHGLRPVVSEQVLVRNWKSPPEGLIGMAALRTHPEIILCENPTAALQVRQFGCQNVVALRGARDGTEELRDKLKAFSENGVRRVYVISRRQVGALAKVLTGGEIDVVPVQVPGSTGRITGEILAVIGPLTGDSPAGVEVKLLGRTESRLTFQAGDTVYRVDAVGGLGFGSRTRVRAERGGVSFIDRLDLAVAGPRKNSARACGASLGVLVRDVEGHLGGIADRLDGIEAEAVESSSQEPRELSVEARAEAEALRKSPGFFDALTGALERHLGLVGEEANKRLAILVVASRLLPKPAGAIVRGPAGSGKSELIHGVCKLLPPSEVLYFSRLTAQSLFFMPREALLHRLLLVDEYEGLESAEYPLRTMMSSQTLSLAITLREGGRVPVTRTIQIPASLAVLVSATQAVNIENLSRFIELRTDDSADQTRRVMRELAVRSNGAPKPPGSLATLQNAFGLLKPCRVKVPFAERLTFSAESVLARRQFGQVIALISAHAAMMQAGRKRLESPEGELVIQAEKSDFRAVYGLLRHVVEHFEDEVSSAAMDLLNVLKSRRRTTITRKQAMEFMGWSYGKAHNVLKELAGFDLLLPDRSSNGLLRTYEVTPFHLRDKAIAQIVSPEDI